METHVATKKDHRCHVCGRRIPLGARYFYSDEPEHTNCMEYENEPLLRLGYNQNRKVGEVKSVGNNEIDNYGRLV